ncbi:MAG: rhodanese-like domain-containing protein [Planctomycetia bacterium]
MTDQTPLERSAVDIRRLLAEAHPGECLLLDCRTPEEHATARIAGSLLIPIDELTGRVGEIEAWRPRQIFVHCHHGIRSLKVANWLRQRGFTAVTSMRGGIDAWSTDVDPSVPRY